MLIDGQNSPIMCQFHIQKAKYRKNLRISLKLWSCYSCHRSHCLSPLVWFVTRSSLSHFLET